MDGKSEGVRDPAAHQPSKAELEQEVSINATPEALGWAVTRGGAQRRGKGKSDTPTDSAST